MMRFAIDPPDDAPYTPRVICATRGCADVVDVPEREVFCYVCRCDHLTQSAAQRVRSEEPCHENH
jgi:hypothetical protein